MPRLGVRNVKAQLVQGDGDEQFAIQVARFVECWFPPNREEYSQRLICTYSGVRLHYGLKINGRLKQRSKYWWWKREELMLLFWVLPLPGVFGLWLCIVSSTVVLMFVVFFTKIFQGEITGIQLLGRF